MTNAGDTNGAGSNRTGGDKRLRPCPVCSKMSTPADHPFCSDRCAKVDLNRWLSGAYAVPVPDNEGDEETEGQTPQ